MLTRADDAAMFVCDCPHCGRRELRSARSLHPVLTDDAVRWTATCRACATPVTIVLKARAVGFRQPVPSERVQAA